MGGRKKKRKVGICFGVVGREGFSSFYLINYTRVFFVSVWYFFFEREFVLFFVLR